MEIETTQNFKNQGNIYSSYKSRTTAKVLIGVNPQGGASFISDAYEGAISDYAITEQCGILDYIEPGDMVLADRGFNIENLLVEKQATLVIPPYKSNRPALSLEEEAETRLISKARIHVERFNQRFKSFRYLNLIPQKKINLLSQVVFVIGCLANFSRILAK